MHDPTQRLANWTLDDAVVHVSTYARPPDVGTVPYVDGYAWIQNNLQYTIRDIEGAEGEGEGAVAHENDTRTKRFGSEHDQGKKKKTHLSLHFDEGGQQVNSYSWVMGAANIQDGSRFFVENVPGKVS